MNKVLVPILLLVVLSTSACAPLLIGVVSGAVVADEIDRHCWRDYYSVRHCR